MVDRWLKLLIDLNASDLHLKVGNKPIIRLNGELKRVEEEEKLFQEDLVKIVEELIPNEKRRNELEEDLSTDFSYSIAGVGRFRINISLTRGSYLIVARAIPFEVPTIEGLKLPEVLKEISKAQNGIILVTGATGSGKSTTVAAILNYINEHYSKNIISFEEPIEYLHKDKKSIVSQKEIPDDIKNYKSALKYVLRQDPDIIFMGELRDQDTIEAAIKASETGHLVISTLHTVTATKTITRILDYYPSHRAQSLRYQLAENIRAVISQRLLKTLQGGKRVATEIMINTGTVAELMITEEGMRKIPEIIKKSESIGMKNFDKEILKLYKDGIIDYETAHNASTIKTDLEMAKSGITSGVGTGEYY